MGHTRIHTKCAKKPIVVLKSSMIARAKPNLFSQLLRERRKALRLTQAELAARSGLSASAVEKLEGGQRHPSQQVAEALADALQVSPKERAHFLHVAKGVAGDPGEQGATRTNLPAYLTPLIGRADSLAQVAALLTGAGLRLLTLTGPPGIGKTRLAIQAASNLLPFFPDGVFLVSLAPVYDESLVLRAIAGTLGLRESGREPLSLTLKEHLREQTMLLVLDNFEQVVRAAPSVAELLWGCPGVKIIVASREALHVRGEHQYQVPSLDNDSSVQLFVERAEEVGAGFSLTKEERTAVQEICARMEGVPLAIELVAARARVLPPRAILARLGSVGGGGRVGSDPVIEGRSALPMLVGGSRDLPHRHRTLRSAISWSYDLLSEDERTLLARLGVFVGGFTLSAVEAVCNAKEDLSMSTLDGLESLLDKNLLKRESGGGGEGEEAARYSTLETIREYALERLVESGSGDTLRLLHAQYYLAIFSALNSTTVHEQDRRLLEKLDREYDNLRAAISWVIGNGRSDLAAQLGITLLIYWMTRALFQEGRSWLQRIIAAQPDPSRMEAGVRSKLAQLLYLEGIMSIYLTDYSSARDSMERSLRIYDDLGEESLPGIASTLCGLGQVARMQGDYAAAELFLEKSLGICKALGGHPRIGGVLWTLGITVGERGDFERSQALLNEAIGIAREQGDLYNECGSLRDLAIVLGFAGQHEEAIVLFEKFLSLARQRGFRVGIGWALDGMAFSVMRLGDHARGEQLYKESLETARVTERHRIPDSLEGLAEIELARSRGEAAQESAVRAAALLGAAEAVRAYIKGNILPVKAPFREHLVTQVSLCLGASEYEGAYTRGKRMSLEEALDFAIDARVREHERPPDRKYRMA